MPSALVDIASFKRSYLLSQRHNLMRPRYWLYYIISFFREYKNTTSNCAKQCEIIHNTFEFAGLNVVQGLDISILRVLCSIWTNKFHGYFLLCQWLDMSNFIIGAASSSFHTKREEELRSYSSLISIFPRSAFSLSFSSPSTLPSSPPEFFLSD